MKDKITIITATFNIVKDGREKLFRECIESVHNQTYPYIEHIIIDGASTDGTLDIIKEYEKKGWLKCYSEPDKGMDDAFNKGLKKSSGKYIAFMNSDDAYYSNDIIAYCINEMEKEKADFCYGSEKQFSREGEYLTTWEPQVPLFWIRMPFSHQTLITTKEAMEKIGNYNDNYGICSDYEVVIKLIIGNFKGIEIPRVISKYHLGGISTQKESKKERLHLLYVIANRLLSFYKQFYPEITFEQCLDIFKNQDKADFPKYFLQRLTFFLIEKKLSFFDYNSFLDCLNIFGQQNIDKIILSKENTKRYYFLGFPILEKKENQVKTKYYLFTFLPILKIKKLKRI